MNEDTKKLLEECNSGCKMAINSMNQVGEYVQDDRLKKVFDNYKGKHGKMEEESAEMLKECGLPEKEPGAAASAFSWITTEMKMMMKDDNNQIAKLMMDGCNMGVKSITEDQHKYADASKEAMALSKKLVQADEDFMNDLKAFL